MRWIFFIMLPIMAAAEDSTLPRHFAEPNRELPPIVDGKWEPLDGETITLIGGSEVVEMDQSGHFEAFLQYAFPEKKLRVRNISWHADTVYLQQRPRFFYTKEGDTRPGSVPDQRNRIEPGTLVLFFGKMESLDGLEALPGFQKTSEQLLGQLAEITPRIIVVGPTFFDQHGPAAALATERNAVLDQYRSVLKKITVNQDLLFVDVDPREGNSGQKLWMDDGIHFAENTRATYAASIVGALTQDKQKTSSIQKKTSDQSFNVLTQKVIAKNKLWNQYYRPTNWAFLFGDRQHVPSSRGHKDEKNRWFVKEIKALEPLLDQADEVIHQAAASLK